jgi:hypothetical protein
MAECKCCNRDLDLRFGFCFDCAETESVLEEGVDMYDKEIPKQEGMSTSMSKVQYILKKYGVLK